MHKITQSTSPTIMVDGWVEVTTDGGRTWTRINSPIGPRIWLDHPPDAPPPWSIPHAVEIARTIHATHFGEVGFAVRVVDTNDKFVEAFPKAKAVTK